METNEEKKIEIISDKIISHLRKENWEIDKKGYNYFDVKKAIEMAFQEGRQEKKLLKELRKNETK